MSCSARWREGRVRRKAAGSKGSTGPAGSDARSWAWLIVARGLMQ